MKIFILLFLFLNLIAQDDYSFRVAYGKASSSDFGEIIFGNIKPHEEDLKVLAFDGGYLLAPDIFELPIDFYIKGSLSCFDENGLQDNIYEATLYLKLYYNIDFLDNRVRVGFGDGVSYTSHILITEYMEAQNEIPVDNNSKFLNYIDVSLDFDIGKLVGYESLHGTYIGWALKHRSGVFGLINNVKKGGSNYNTLYIERNF